MPGSPGTPSRHHLRSLIAFATTSVLLAGGYLAVVSATAQASNEPVNVWLTTTNDSGGRNVTRGLQQQAPIAFSAGSSGSGQVVAIDENTRYQQFTGAGASFTDTPAWLMNTSGALSGPTRPTPLNNP